MNVNLQIRNTEVYTIQRIVVEMELEEKKDDGTEKGKDDKKEKKKKEKKVKVPKEKVDPGPSCITTLSDGLDMAARDNRGINTEINVSIKHIEIIGQNHAGNCESASHKACRFGRKCATFINMILYVA